MSITVTVGLLSGKTAVIAAALDEEVGAVKRRAETAPWRSSGWLLGL